MNLHQIDLDALDLEAHDGDLIAVAVHQYELIAALVAEVRSLRQLKHPSFEDVEALRKQVASLANQVQALSGGVEALEKRPQPVAQSVASTVRVEPTHEMALHLKADTTLRVSSQSKDGVRVATFKLE